MVENDEVSQRLLEKLTTPKKNPRMMSFSYSNFDRNDLKLEFNSEIESSDDGFDNKSSSGLLPLNDFIISNMENSYF